MLAHFETVQPGEGEHETALREAAAEEAVGANPAR